MTEYKNSIGPLPISCGSSGALVHWKHNSRQKANPSSVLGYTKEVEHGGHVIKYPRNASKKQHIVPLCREHYHPTFTNCFYINARISFIRAKSLTYCTQ
jgi:hypothetical protein